MDAVEMRLRESGGCGVIGKISRWDRPRNEGSRLGWWKSEVFEVLGLEGGGRFWFFRWAAIER